MPTLSRPTSETSRSRAARRTPDSSSGSASMPVTSCAESQVSIASWRSARSSGDSVGRPDAPSAGDPVRVRHCSSDRLSAQNFFVASSSTPSSATSVFALRSTADAGLFSSCARPAASRPSEAIFSSSSSLDLNTRARSTITCTSTAVSSSHSWISRGRFGSRDHEHGRALFRDDIARRRLDAGIRQHAGDVAAVPLHDDARAGAAVDANQEVAVEHDEEALDGAGAGRQDDAGLECFARGRSPPARRADRVARRSASDARPGVREGTGLPCRGDPPESYTRREDVALSARPERYGPRTSG